MVNKVFPPVDTGPVPSKEDKDDKKDRNEKEEKEEQKDSAMKTTVEMTAEVGVNVAATVTESKGFLNLSSTLGAINTFFSTLGQCMTMDSSARVAIESNAKMSIGYNPENYYHANPSDTLGYHESPLKKLNDTLERYEHLGI